MNTPRVKSATVSDVARSAGVSVGTVSRVLNGYTNIVPANLEKVQAAMKELGYQKCHSAGLLVGRRRGSVARTGNIGLVYSEMGPEWANHPLAAAYAQGVNEGCDERGFHALTETVVDSKSLPRCIRDGKIDGLLIKATRRAPEFLADLPPNFPVVGISMVDPTCPIHQVAPDNRGAGFIVTEYLWRMGHRRIAFFLTDATHPMFVGRYQGYEEFLRTRRAFDPTRVIVQEHGGEKMPPEIAPPDFTPPLNALLSSGELPTAIITSNDWAAKGLYAALAERKLRVPDDVSVIGFDNMDTFCELMTPPLSSFAIPFVATARAAAHALFDRIENPNGNRERGLQLIGGSLIERASVKNLALA